MIMRAYVGTTPTITDTILDEHGAAVDLTGATVSFRYRPDGASTPVVSLAATPDPDQVANRGKVTIVLGSPLLDAPADWVQWWHALFSGSVPLETGNTALIVQDHGPVPGEGDAGPCQAWVTSDDVSSLNAASAGVDYSAEAAMASELLYQWSGRQFPGACTRTVRPCRAGCAHWGLAQLGFDAAFPWNAWDITAGGWSRFRDYPAPDGCGRLSIVPLPGHVREVTSVLVSGVTLDPSSYRVDKSRQLVGLYDSLGKPVYFPACQDMRAADNGQGAFAVTYTWGRSLPAAGVRAAAALALQLWNLDNNPDACKLPKNVTRLIRQGVTVERDSSKPTLGVPVVDAFLAAYNPGNRRRASAVYSPDLPRYPRRTAT